MYKIILRTGCIFMVVGVSLAAIGSHVLQDHVTPKVLDAFITAVQFLIFHGLAFLAIGKQNVWSLAVLKRIYWILVLGTCCFSGSIFLLTLFKYLAVELSVVPLITPLGGVLLITGWSYAGLKVG